MIKLTGFLRLHDPERGPAGKGRSVSPLDAAKDGLDLPGAVHAQDPLGSPVPLSTKGSGARVAAVLGLPDVIHAGGVGQPGAVGGADGVNVAAAGARVLAMLADVALRAVAGDAGAHARDLELVAGVVLEAAGNVRPSAILLKWKEKSLELHLDFIT